MESTKLVGKKRKERDDIVVMDKASTSSAPAVIDLTSGNFHASLSAGSTSASALNGSLAPKDQEANDDIIDLTVDNPRIPVKQKKSLIYNEVQILETADKGTSMTPKRVQQVAITEGTSSSVKQKAIQNAVAKSTEEVNSPFGNCPICLDSMEEPASTICGHLFCYSCIKQWNKSHKVCPTSADWEECGPNIRVRRIVEDEKQGASIELLTCRHAINVLPFGAQSVFAEQEFYGNLVDNSQEAVANEDDAASGDKSVKLRKKKVKCFEDYYEDKESKELLKSDPLEWKEQDHYAMLGLSNLRAEASQDDIKKAYRKKVLKHHPDKKAAEEKTKKGHDNFFKCVQKAFEVLSDPVKRRQFDSVDKFFDDSIPSKLDDKSLFFDVFGPVFERNARFSVKKNIPDLGDEETPRAQVEAFYNFWTNFQSWRSFELMDEEPVDDSMSRDERRWYERQNKAQREKLKREENARIHKLVDAAISSDPRVQKFKEEDRILKEQKKKEKEEVAARMKAEAHKKEELRLKEIEDEKKRLEKEKNEKIELKAELKKCRRELRGLFKNLNSEDSKKLDAVIFNFEDNLEQLKGFIERANSSADSLSLLSEASESIPKDTPKVQVENRAESSNVAKEASEEKPWSVEELKLLIKAVNMFPGGTLSRWEKIADFLEQHTGVKRSNKELTRKSNEVRGADFLKFKANSLQESEKVQSEPVGEATLKEQPEPAAQSKPWTAEEQAQLEKAMKEFPASKYKGSERWDKVATRVGGRSKKEIMQRVKEIVQALKAKQK